jgi:gamma-glutamyl:cysteine ligase YbdK (ATP-grasp superfamily)
MLQEMRKIEHETIAAARDEDSRLVRIGAYPGSFHDLAVTQQPYRYQYLMDISHYLHDIRYGRHDQATPISVGDITLPIKRCDVMSGCQSVHINIQMPAGELAVRLLNKAIEMTPYLVALGAHSPLMNCQHSGYMEYRMPLWEPLFTFPNIDTKYGVNTRRTGLPDYYYRSWDDYWRDVGRKLYLTHETERALETNMKVFWRTVRLKPCPGREHDCLLELRALSTQPTLEEDAAFYLLFSGLIHEPAWYERPLLPLEYVKVNFDLVSIYGLDTELYVQEGSTIARRPARAILKALLDEALALWRSHSPESADLVALLYKRLRPETGSPAHQSVRLFDEAMQQGHTPAAAAQQVLLAYVIGSEQQVKSL